MPALTKKSLQTKIKAVTKYTEDSKTCKGVRIIITKKVRHNSHLLNLVASVAEIAHHDIFYKNGVVKAHINNFVFENKWPYSVAIEPIL